MQKKKPYYCSHWQTQVVFQQEYWISMVVLSDIDMVSIWAQMNILGDFPDFQLLCHPEEGGFTFESGSFKVFFFVSS